MPGIITAENLGAWLVKCDPTVWDLAGYVDDGLDTIEDTWTVQDNYRSTMMRAGDRVVFWVSGTSPRFPRGIWGLGHVTGDAGEMVELTEELDDGYWLDEEAMLAARYSVPVLVRLRLGAPVTDADLRAAGIDDLEVQRTPSGSNPSWVSAEQLARVGPLLGAWPEPPGPRGEITVGEWGAGLGDALQNREVELAAMAEVTAAYTAEGWTVTDVSGECCGWDLTCERPGGEVARVEVKGVSGNRPVVLLTANEIRAARERFGWTLAVVTRALGDAPVLHTFTAREAVTAAVPYVFRADLTG